MAKIFSFEKLLVYKKKKIANVSFWGILSFVPYMIYPCLKFKDPVYNYCCALFLKPTLLGESKINIILNHITSFNIDLKAAGIRLKNHTFSKDILISNSLPQITYYSQGETFNIPKTPQGLNALIKSRKPKYLILAGCEKCPLWLPKRLKENAELFNPKNLRFYITAEGPGFFSTMIYRFNH